jgi:hypothetical protein
MGSFCFRKFIVSKELREMMGLPTDENLNLPNSIGLELSTKSVDNLIKPTKNTKMSNGLYGVKKNLFLKEAFLKKDEKPKLSTERGIPSELIEMQKLLELDKGGICKLMTFCKAGNMRLQDVWKYIKQRILKAGIKAGRAFRYLEKLISCYDVWQKVSQWKEKIFPKDKVLKEDDNRRFWNKYFYGTLTAVTKEMLKEFCFPPNVQVKIFDGTAEIIYHRNRSEFVSSEHMDKIYKAIKCGLLKIKGN